jgi:hypothetical protein
VSQKFALFDALAACAIWQAFPGAFALDWRPIISVDSAVLGWQSFSWSQLTRSIWIGTKFANSRKLKCSYRAISPCSGALQQGRHEKGA